MVYSMYYIFHHSTLLFCRLCCWGFGWAYHCISLRGESSALGPLNTGFNCLTYSLQLLKFDWFTYKTVEVFDDISLKAGVVVEAIMTFIKIFPPWAIVIPFVCVFKIIHICI
jgi:hypothetical protein